MKLQTIRCAAAGRWRSPSPSRGAADKVKIGFITNSRCRSSSTMENAAKAYAAAHPGVEIIYGQGQSATDIEGQIALIESMVTQGVQGIAITPVDPTVAPALDKAVAAGIKVVLMDNNIPDWKGKTALAATNNYNGGKIAGEYLKTVLKDGDTIGILEGVPGVPALDDRVNGMLEGLGDVKVEVVGKGGTNCTQELGVSVTEDMLTANPDLKAIYAACGPPAAGAAQAIENAGIANDNHPGRLRRLLRRDSKRSSRARKTPPLRSSRPRWASSASTPWSRRSAAKRSRPTSTPAPASSRRERQGLQ